MKIYERIKKLRKDLNLTQEDFAKKIKISRSNLANIESGQVKVTDRVIWEIVEKFSVSFDWLKTGEGEMYVQTTDSEIDKLCKKIGLDNLGKAFLIAYADLPEADRAAIKNYIISVADSVSYEEFRKDYIAENAKPIAARNGETDNLQELADAFDKKDD